MTKKSVQSSVTTMMEVEKDFSKKKIPKLDKGRLGENRILGGVCEYCGVRAEVCPHYGSKGAVSKYLEDRKRMVNLQSKRRMEAELDLGVQVTSAAVFEE